MLLNEMECKNLVNPLFACFTSSVLFFVIYSEEIEDAQIAKGVTKPLVESNLTCHDFKWMNKRMAERTNK